MDFAVCVVEFFSSAREPSFQAVESLKKVAECITNAEEGLVPLLRRLAEGDYNSTRIASAPLFASIYPKISESSTKVQLRA